MLSCSSQHQALCVRLLSMGTAAPGRAGPLPHAVASFFFFFFKQKEKGKIYMIPSEKQKVEEWDKNLWGTDQRRSWSWEKSPYAERRSTRAHLFSWRSWWYFEHSGSALPLDLAPSLSVNIISTGASSIPTSFNFKVKQNDFFQVNLGIGRNALLTN